MSLPRLLLLSDVVPGAPGVGGVYLEDLCALYPPDRLACCVIGEAPVEHWPSALARAARTSVPRPPEHGFLRLGRHVHRRTRGPYERYVTTRTRRETVPRVVRFARESAAEAICVPLASPTSIRVAAEIAGVLGLPLHALVWDPPRYYLSEYWKLRGAALEGLLHAFGDALARSDRCAVMSDEMGLAYQRAYGTPWVVMQHGIARRWWRQPARAPSRDRLTIAFAGSLYARAEWNALLTALAGVQWRVANREVVVRFLGTRLDAESATPARIEFLGWRDRADTLALLAESDVCYLPYWFSPEYAEVVRQAFPTKLPTYLAAGRPVFLHAPADSSPARFFDRYRVGVRCSSLEPRQIIAALEALVGDAEGYRRASAAGRVGLEECFDLGIFRARAAEWLGVEQHLLEPVDRAP